jgi:tetratricopeptide (TPR) repeat protein
VRKLLFACLLATVPLAAPGGVLAQSDAPVQVDLQGALFTVIDGLNDDAMGVAVDARSTVALQSAAARLDAEARSRSEAPNPAAVIAAVEQTIGADDPLTPALLTELAAELKLQGDYSGAEALLRHAAASHERIDGGLLQDWGTHYALALLLEGEGRQAEADAMFARVAEIANAFDTTSDPRVLAVMQQIVDQRATAGGEPVPGAWLTAIARWRAEQEDADGLLKYGQSAVDRLSEAAGPESSTVIEWRTEFARRLYAAGRAAAATEVLLPAAEAMTRRLASNEPAPYAEIQRATEQIDLLYAHGEAQAAGALAVAATERMRDLEDDDVRNLVGPSVFDALAAADRPDLVRDLRRRTAVLIDDPGDLVFEAPEEPVIASAPVAMGGSSRQAMRDALSLAQDAIRANLGKAGIAYNAPDTMQFGEAAAVELALATEVSGLTAADLLDDDLKGAIESETGVDFALNMQATLSGPDFKIEPAGPQIRTVLEDAKWNWTVEPIRYGADKLLVLELHALPQVEGLDGATAHPLHVQTFRREILVDVDPWSRAVSMADDVKKVHASAVAVGATLIAVAGWLWRRRRASAGSA